MIRIRAPLRTGMAFTWFFACEGERAPYMPFIRTGWVPGDSARPIDIIVNPHGRVENVGRIVGTLRDRRWVD